LISKICVILQCEGKLSMTEVIGRLYGMIQPLKQIAKGKQSLIEGQHDFWVCEVCGRGKRPKCAYLENSHDW